MKTEQQRLPRFAVLIDADNTSPQIAGGFFEEVAKFGEASVRRHLRGFFQPAAQVLDRNSPEVCHRPISAICLYDRQERLRHRAGDRRHGPAAQAAGSTASVWYRQHDFTRLASRLREQGATSPASARRKRRKVFRQACRRFIYTENLLPQTPTSNSQRSADIKSLQPPSAALPLLKKASSQIESDDGWVRLDLSESQLTTWCRISIPAATGFTKLSDLVRNTGMFDVEKNRR